MVMSLIPPYALSLVWVCPLNLQAKRAVMYNPTTCDERQMCGKICYSFYRSIRATIMPTQPKGNSRCR